MRHLALPTAFLFFVFLGACQADLEEVASTNTAAHAYNGASTTAITTDKAATANPAGSDDKVAKYGARAAKLPICAPQPAVWNAPKLQDEAGVIDGECKLNSVLVDSNADGVPESKILVTRSGNLTTVHYKHGKRVYTTDSAGRVIRREQHSNYGSRTWIVQQAFDEAGRVVMYGTKSVQKHDGAIKYAHRVEQTFSHGRLASRTTTNQNGPAVRTTWTWNKAGKLVLSERRIGSPDAAVQAAAAWTYDDAGRPTEVKRTIKGKPSMVARWSWAPDGTLRSRDVTVSRANGAQQGGRLDTYDAPTGTNPSGCYGCGYYGGSAHGAQPWQDAMMRVEEGCRTLPVAVGHGYPGADYALSDAEDKQLIGHKYAGYYAYGYGYGYYGYYGYYGGGPRHASHIGGGGSWDALALIGKFTAARFTIAYDDEGRMVKEALHVTPITDSKTAAKPHVWLRVRSFNAAGLAKDVVLKDGVPQRTLQFQRDAAGRLIRRELVITGHAVEVDSWQRDANGMPLVREHRGLHQHYKYLHPGAKPTTIPAPQLMMRLVRTWDERGRTLSARVENAVAGHKAQMMRWVWDDKDRVVGRSIALGDQPESQVQTWAFDSDGRETMKTSWSRHSKGVARWFQKTSYNKAGQRTKMIRGQDPSQEATWRELRDYTCK